MAEIVFLSNVRLSFPSLVEARASTEGGVKKFAADFIMDQTDPGFIKFMQEVQNVAMTKWPQHFQPILGLIQGDRKFRCYGAGSEKIDPKTYQPYLGYDGKVYISASNKDMPQMIGPDGRPTDPTNLMAYQALARKLYGGCYVNAAVKPWPQDNKHGRGIRGELVAVQFFRDGEPFGEGTPDVSGMFGQVAAPVGNQASGGQVPPQFNPFQPAPAAAPQFQPTPFQPAPFNPFVPQ